MRLRVVDLQEALLAYPAEAEVSVYDLQLSVHQDGKLLGHIDLSAFMSQTGQVATKAEEA